MHRGEWIFDKTNVKASDGGGRATSGTVANYKFMDAGHDLFRGSLNNTNKN